MKDNIQKRKETFEKELNNLIRDFSDKKEHYYLMYQKMSWGIIIISAAISFFLGLSFMEDIAVYVKLIALFLSSCLVVLNGAMGFLNYKKLYEQRTITLIQLLILRREFRIVMVGDGDEEKLNMLFEKLESIMKEDLNIWLDNLSQKGK